MKNIKFLVGILTVLVLMASCTPMQNLTSDEMNDPRTTQVGNRLYVQDPFYGNVVLERDPFTGRYYDVTYGSRFGTGAYGGYPYRGGYRGYNRGGYYRNVPVQRQAPVRQEAPQERQETRKKVLGN